jgi:hypothetical protein
LKPSTSPVTQIESSTSPSRMAPSQPSATQPAALAFKPATFQFKPSAFSFKPATFQFNPPTNRQDPLIGKRGFTNRPANTQARKSQNTKKNKNNMGNA